MLPVWIASMLAVAAEHALVVRTLIELGAAVERLPLQVLQFVSLCIPVCCLSGSPQCWRLLLGTLWSFKRSLSLALQLRGCLYRCRRFNSLYLYLFAACPTASILPAAAEGCAQTAPDCNRHTDRCRLGGCVPCAFVRYWVPSC